MRFRRFVPLLFMTIGAMAAGSTAFAIGSFPPALPFGPSMPSSFAGHPRITPGQILVRLKRGADSSRFYRETGLRRIRRLDAIDVDIVAVAPGAENQTADALGARADVRYAEPDGIAVALTLPNDPLYSQFQWYLPLIHMPDAWNLSTGSPKVTIAILDTGIDASHPDLKDKIVPGYNVTDPGNDPVDDVGHGTHVSGLAAASSNNGMGIAGVDWAALIMPIRVLGPSGEGSNSAIARGLIWAANHGARIMNLSLGSPVYDSALADAVRYVQNKNDLVIAAAGNDYLNGNPISYPGALPGVIAVGASTFDDHRTSYSETGSYISVVAPGGDPLGAQDPDMNHWIVSTWRTLETQYKIDAGTSQATPLVSGLAGLIASVRPDMTGDQIRQVIESTATQIGASRQNPQTGFGRIDAGAALTSLGLSQPQAPAVSISFPAAGAIVSGTVSIQGSVEGAGIQSFQIQYGIGAQPALWFNLGTVRSQAVHQGELASWNTADLDDGVYSLRVTAVDASGNVTTAGPLAVTVDNTPPAVTIASPAEGQTVLNLTQVVGSATDDHFSKYVLDLGAGTDPDLWINLIEGKAPVSDHGALGQVNLAGRPAGVYTLRILATDAAGNTTQAKVHIRFNAPVPGDVNGDGKIDITDVILILQMAVGDQPIADLSLADVAPVPGTDGRAYGDGKVTVLDALRVLRRVLKLEPDPWPG